MTCEFSLIFCFQTRRWNQGWVCSALMPPTVKTRFSLQRFLWSVITLLFRWSTWGSLMVEKMKLSSVATSRCSGTRLQVSIIYDFWVRKWEFFSFVVFKPKSFPRDDGYGSMTTKHKEKCSAPIRVEDQSRSRHNLVSVSPYLTAWYQKWLFFICWSIIFMICFLRIQSLKNLLIFSICLNIASLLVIFLNNLQCHGSLQS